MLTGLLALALVLAGSFDGDALSLRADRAVPPVRPVNTLAGGAVVVQVRVNNATGERVTTVLQGTPPFTAASLNALRQWLFSAPAGMNAANTSVTFFFRPQNPHPISPSRGPAVSGTAEDRPAVPLAVLDPGYPIMVLAEGAVVLEVSVSADGRVSDIGVLNSVAGLTDHAVLSVKSWRFLPALRDGKPAASTAYVVMSFMLP